MKYLLLPALALLLVQCIGSKEDKTVSKDLYGQRIGGSYRNSHFHFGLDVDSSWTIKKRGYQNRFHPDLFEADFFHPDLPEDYNSINITIEAEKANPFSDDGVSDKLRENMEATHFFSDEGDYREDDIRKVKLGGQAYLRGHVEEYYDEDTVFTTAYMRYQKPYFLSICVTYDSDSLKSKVDQVIQSIHYVK